MEYMVPQEVLVRRDAVREAMELLLVNRMPVGKPRSSQWLFFRACVELLLGGLVDNDFLGLPSNRAAQFKFEVEDRLRRFYQRSGRPVDFVFTLVHKTRLADYGLTAGYPDVSGYCALVRDMGADAVGARRALLPELGQYLERVVAACIDAEFEAYAALPEIREEPLNRYFCANSPAIREILTVLTRHRERGRVLRNPFNPSTKRLLGIKVKKLDADEAVVATTEYWYLRWWNEKKEEYDHSYRETNRQLYVLRPEGNDWKVFVNLRPMPRSSAPGRRKRR